MMKKLKTAFIYFKTRWYEFQLCMKEFFSGKKLSDDAYRAFYENSMMLMVHRIEKGLGLRNTEPGHSQAIVIELLDRAFGFLNRGYDKNSFALKETFVVLTAYVNYQQAVPEIWEKMISIHHKYEEFYRMLDIGYTQSVVEKLNAGAHIYKREDLLNGKKFDFEGFIRTRHSIRMFRDEAISDNLLYQAVKIANFSPSACNRQPSNVYFASVRNKVARIDALITGNNGFKGDMPNYVIVTTDRARFSGEEQFQWYINGGIYLSFLTLAMHSLGIGSCIMQWKAFYSNEKKLKVLAGISEHEAIIAIVGCGFYDEYTTCICAQRKEASENLHIIGE